MIGIEQALALKLLAQFVDHGLEAATGSDLENRVPAHDSEVRFIHRFGLP